MFKRLNVKASCFLYFRSLIFYRPSCLFDNNLIKSQYTSALTVFDALGVDLVHGWIVDPQDKDTFNTLRGKSYNQLIDLVITGKEADEEAQKVSESIQRKKIKLENCRRSSSNREDRKESSVEATAEEDQNNDWVKVSKEEDILSADAGDKQEKHDDTDEVPLEIEVEKSVDEQRTLEPSKAMESKNILDPLLNPIAPDQVEKEIACLQDKLERAQGTASVGNLINAFLNDTGHQLTYHGLEKLQEYISNGQLCVFFRNNHFSTITKHNGHLFLLVTDLGYANVEEVVWEKLDNIHGDTDYADCKFQKPRPRSVLSPPAPVLSPKLVLAQKGQQDLDYQLAVRLSEGKALDDAALDEEEAALIAAATEASLHSYHANGTDLEADSKPAASPTADSGNVVSSGNDHHDHDADYRLAMQLQQQLDSEEASEALARQLQEEDRVAASRQRSPPRTGPFAGPTRSQATSSDNKSGCIIS